MKSKGTSGIILIFLLFILLLQNSPASGSDTASLNRNSRYGIFAGANYDIYKSDFSKFKNVPNCCPKFTDGNGWGYTIGLSWELPLPYSLYLGLNAAYSDLSGTFKSKEYTQIRIDDRIEQGAFEHVVEAGISDFSFEPNLTWNIYKRLELTAGGHIGFVTGKSYRQYEELTEPADRGFFVDTKKRKRNSLSGDIPDFNDVLGFVFAGVQYSLPLNNSNTFSLVPFLRYSLGMNLPVRDLDWKINYTLAGIGLKYSPKDKEPEKPKEELKHEFLYDTAIKVTTEAYRRKFAVGEERTDTKVEVKTKKIITIVRHFRTDTIFKAPVLLADIDIQPVELRLKSRYVTQAFPVLNLLFFGKDSSVISDYYVTGNEESFNIENLEINPVNYYKNLLLIFGKRLKENPDINITLTGTSDSTTENSNCSLAQERAEAVSTYFIKSWGIDASRIRINKLPVLCNPENPTFTKNDSGYAENRRVEITSGFPELFAPVIRRRFLEINADTVLNIRVTPKLSVNEGIIRWSLTAKNRFRTLLSREGTGYPGNINGSLNIENTEPVDVSFEIFSADSQLINSSHKIEVITDTNEIEIERLSLILFEVSSEILPELSKKELQSFIISKEQIENITVTGYSDILGTTEFNKSLSENRAKNTARFILSMKPGLEINNIKGVGTAHFPPGIKSFGTPAERFLSRTVFIEVLKKWK